MSENENESAPVSLPTSVTRGEKFAGRAVLLPSGRSDNLDDSGSIHDLKPVDAKALLEAGYVAA